MTEATDEVKTINKNELENNEAKVDFTLKIQLNDGFDDKVKEFLDKSGITNNVLAGEKAIFALQTLHEADELILKKSVARNEMPKSSIRLEMLTSNGEKIELPKVDMGRYLFKNADLNKIINVSSSKVVENQISQETQKAFADLMKKDSDGRFKTGINLDNILENGVKGLEGIADSIGDEHLSSFVKNFTTAYSVLGAKKEDSSLDKDTNNSLSRDKEKASETPAINEQSVAMKETQKQEQSVDENKPKTSKIPDGAISAIKEQAGKEISKIKKTKTKEKTISKPTDIGRGM
ncbi:hypothetical protein GZ989_011290 (plasmid) [Campylobacter fetus]|uniref:Uncharacterized protein n=1 Tax=Campylobacter fetus TaxID=196 RepID=A0A974RKS3_CAMFE|nr:hypothetical protein [Campylobacter fetus]OCS32889.1 hypothetical protein AWR31_08085 [Campylobacter fetus subsp. venerealis]QMS59890.1 hypothetical protein GZ989_011290 [Campylobacter fetus]